MSGLDTAMITNRILAIGTRVRVKGNPSGIQLRSSTGEIVRIDDLDGYYIVRLDEPAMSYDDPETEEEVSEIVEAADNLELIEPAWYVRAASATEQNRCRTDGARSGDSRIV